MAKTNSSKTYLSKNLQAARAFAKGIQGSERSVLERVAEASILGEIVPPELQKTANAILGVALLEGKLPKKALGRPIDEIYAVKGVEAAYCFFELLDQKVHSRNQILMLVAIQVHTTVRNVERYIRDYAWLIGGLSDSDYEARRRFRAWRAGLTDEEYREAVLLELRFHEGSPPTGQRSLNEKLAAASDQVLAMRAKLRELTDLASGELTIKID